VEAVESPRTLEFEDGFADADGKPSDTMPTSRSRVRIESADAGTTRMVITAIFPTEEAMDQLIEMGMDEGIRLAVGQTDELLREGVPARP
jgi:uncharacterized protein YndB with AHSA1/START domain